MRCEVTAASSTLWRTPSTSPGCPMNFRVQTAQHEIKHLSHHEEKFSNGDNRAGLGISYRQRATRSISDVGLQ